MRRREFVTLLGGAVAASSRAAQAGPRDRLPTIGFLGASTQSAWSNWVAAFVQRLRQLGWMEGRTIAIEYRWADGHPERYAEIAAEFAQLKVDVIVTVGSATLAAEKSAQGIPIVFAVATDPLGDGLVAGLAHPGGNVTGLSVQSPDLAGKRLELLREILPGVRELAIMANAGYAAALREMDEMQAKAHTLGLRVTRLEVRRAEDITPAIETLKDHADALYVCADSLINANGARIVTTALGVRLATISYAREYVEAGGLMSYGPSYPDLFRRAGDYVDKILHGAKPSDLPVEQPTKFVLTINAQTAKALGIAIPAPLLARADEVIE